MRAHTVAQSLRLERMWDSLVKEAEQAKAFFECESALMRATQAQRNAIPLSGRAPMALVRKLEDLKFRAKHAEWLYDKACTARNAVRELLNGGKIEL